MLRLTDPQDEDGGKVEHPRADNHLPVGERGHAIVPAKRVRVHDAQLRPVPARHVQRQAKHALQRIVCRRPQHRQHVRR
jgi:hypothetical protein